MNHTWRFHRFCRAADCLTVWLFCFLLEKAKGPSVDVVKLDDLDMIIDCNDEVEIRDQRIEEKKHLPAPYM